MTAAPLLVAPTQIPKTAEAPARRRGRLLAYLFLAPTLIGVGVFTVVPIIGSLVLSLFDWNIIDPPTFVGLGNFGEVFTDRSILISFRNTIVFVVAAVGLQLLLALWLASMVQNKLPEWLKTVFRSVFFFPLILSAASISIVMRYLFNQDFGVANWILTSLGLPAVDWLTSPTWAMVTIVLVYVWQNFGFSFLLFLGGLNNIPAEIYEAGELDGATGWSRMRLLTLPLLSPILLVTSVMGFINALQVFDQPYVLTRGGPGDSTRTVVMVIYESAFQQLSFGKASAVGVVLFLVILAVTAVQFRLSRRFVFYQ